MREGKASDRIEVTKIHQRNVPMAPRSGSVSSTAVTCPTAPVTRSEIRLGEV